LVLGFDFIGIALFSARAVYVCLAENKAFFRAFPKEK
jgi:hypothetical protein